MLIRQAPVGTYNSVIRDNLTSIDAIEIHGVRDLSEAVDYEIQEIDNENPLFYSVYVHLKQGGVECIGDFPSLEDAHDYAERLSTQHGWPIR